MYSPSLNRGKKGFMRIPVLKTLFILALAAGLLFPACRSHDSVTGATARAKKDLPKLIAAGTSEDGLSVSLQNKNIGVKGARVLADTEAVKNVRSLALKTNRLGDEGVAGHSPGHLCGAGRGFKGYPGNR